MKSSTFLATVAQAAIASANGPPFGPGGPPGMNFGGGPTCASSCYSSYWQTATPTPSAYCGSSAQGLASCVSSACTADSSDYSSFTSISSSLCSEWSSCSSTGTYTYTYTSPSGAPAGWFGGSWPTGPVTVTGCPWNGAAIGWGIWGPGGNGNGWGSLGTGWAYTTFTATVTATTTTGSSTFTTTELATIAEAVSGSSTTSTTLGSTTSTNTPNAAPTSGNVGVKVMGAALGVVLVGAGLM